MEKKGFNDERRKIAVESPNHPVWATSKPMLFESNDSLRFDFQKLGFLASIDHTVLERLALVESRYLALAASVKQRAEAFRKIKNRMAELYKKGESVTVGALEEPLGGSRVANASTLVAALIAHFEGGDEASCRDVGAALTAAHKKHFGEKTIFGKKRTILGLAPARDVANVGAS